MEESKELKRFLMKVKEKTEKAGLKLNIQKTKIMASGPITSWQIDGEKMEIVTNLNTVLKKRQRHHFAIKVPYSQELWFFKWSCTDVRVGP